MSWVGVVISQTIGAMAAHHTAQPGKHSVEIRAIKCMSCGAPCDLEKKCEHCGSITRAVSVPILNLGRQ